MKILLVILTVGLLGLVVLGGLSWEWGAPWLWPHRWAILDAFDGQVDPTADGRYQFDCDAWNCAGVLPQLPRATEVCCVSSLKPRGACCTTHFQGRYGSEVHIYREDGGQYRITLTVPCPIRERDPQATQTAAERYAQCFEHWGLEPPPAVVKR